MLCTYLIRFLQLTFVSKNEGVLQLRDTWIRIQKRYKREGKEKMKILDVEDVNRLLD